MSFSTEYAQPNASIEAGEEWSLPQIRKHQHALNVRAGGVLDIEVGRIGEDG